MLGCSITPIHPNFYISFFALKYLPKINKTKTPVYLQYLSTQTTRSGIICLLTTNILLSLISICSLFTHSFF